MKRGLVFGLVLDGATDRALEPIVLWALRQVRPDLPLVPNPARVRGGAPLDAFVTETLRLSAPDLLFVHRDAERATHEARLREIPTAGGRIVPVVPVRMTEAWLLFHEGAIRAAAGNPNGRESLDLPPVARLEALPDPKTALRAALLTASGHQGHRRRARFERDLPDRVGLIPTYIDDFSPLRALSAFRAFEGATRAALDRIGPGSAPIPFPSTS